MMDVPNDLAAARSPPRQEHPEERYHGRQERDGNRTHSGNCDVLGDDCGARHTGFLVLERHSCAGEFERRMNRTHGGRASRFTVSKRHQEQPHHRSAGGLPSEIERLTAARSSPSGVASLGVLAITCPVRSCFAGLFSFQAVS